jgi:hypothetical protein
MNPSRYLAARRHFFWRQNTAPTVQKGADNRAFRRLPKYSLKGVPDIIVIKDGRFIGLEVKRQGGYQSPEQKEFERLCNEHAGEYHVVRSIDDVRFAGM